MAGIMRILSQVSAFGRLRPARRSLSGVQMLIDHLGEVSSQATHAGEIVDARAQDALQPAELPQQRPPFDGPQTGDGLEYRLIVSLGPLAPVPRDREAVRLVAHP